MADKVLKRAGHEPRLFVELAWGMRDNPHDFLSVEQVAQAMERWPGVRKPVDRAALARLLAYLARGGKGYGSTLEPGVGGYRWRMDDARMTKA